MKNNKIYTVSQINALIKGAVENNLPGQLTITGEVTDLRPHYSGHCYFALKDENSKLPCVIWKNNLARVKFRLENGQSILATGHIEVYIPHGKYQLMVEKIIPAGRGALQVAFEQMVKRLEAEGLFKAGPKKPLPPYPMRIGIITSQSGAAVGDIRTSIHSRWSCAKLFLYPVPVQGQGAAEKIAVALRDINRRNKNLKLDVLIVGRGGGSLEDLWAFNEEVLARAIYNSKIPVISAVGHEYDTTIADLVADARASTPTKAGVTAVPDITEVQEQLNYFRDRLESKTKWNMQFLEKSLQAFLAREVFRNPLSIAFNAQQQLDEISSELADLIKDTLTNDKDKLHTIYEQIVKIEPHRLLGKQNVYLNNLQNQINIRMKTVLNNSRMQLTAKFNLLSGLNPKSVLKRGYTITTNKYTGKVVTKLEDVEIGDTIITELVEENLIESQVKKRENKRVKKTG